MFWFYSKRHKKSVHKQMSLTIIDLIPVLTKAIQEQQSQIKQLRTY